MKNSLTELEIDIHGFRVEEARAYLKSRLDSAPKTIRFVTVIHGFNRGTALQQMVRKFKHPRVKRIELGLNNGETTYYLN